MSTPVTVDPYANKAVVPAVGTIVTVLLRWLISGDLQLDDEGLVALAGAITTALVYAVSNWRSLLGGARRGEAGQVGPITVLLWLLVAVVIVVLIVWLVGFIR